MLKLSLIAGARPAMAGIGAMAAALAASAAAAQEIRVLNWQGYGTDEAWALEIFEAETGISVVHDYFNSEQEMLTRLRTNPGAYDVVLINAAFTGQAVDEGLIEPVDPSLISNFDDLSADLRDHPYLGRDGEVYGVSWVWGATSYAVNTDVFEEVPTSIEILWDPDHAGHVGWRDDAVESGAVGGDRHRAGHEQSDRSGRDPRAVDGPGWPSADLLEFGDRVEQPDGVRHL